MISGTQSCVTGNAVFFHFPNSCLVIAPFIFSPLPGFIPVEEASSLVEGTEKHLWWSALLTRVSCFSETNQMRQQKPVDASTSQNKCHRTNELLGKLDVCVNVASEARFDSEVAFLFSGHDVGNHEARWTFV